MILKQWCPDAEFTKLGKLGAIVTETYKTQEAEKDKNSSDDECKTSIEAFVENYFSKDSINNIGKIWLTGSPSMGKSVALDIIKIELIKRGIVFYSLNLRELQNKTTDADEFRKLEGAISNTNIQVIVLDSYDELDGYFDNMDSLNKLILSCKKTIILASRDVPEYKKAFVAFNRLVLQEFEEPRLDSIIKGILKDCVENLVEIVKIEDCVKNLAEIVKTTMHLNMLLKLINSDSDETKMSVLLSQNISEFYFLYFKEMVREKVQHEKVALRKTDIFLREAGEYYATRKKSFEHDIGEEFRAIFYLRDDGTIDAVHQNYIDFCIGYYLAYEIADKVDDESAIRKALNIEFRSFEERRALLYAGQCLQITNSIYEKKYIKSGEETFKTLNNVFVKDQSKEYAWLVHIWAAFNKNVLEDDEFVFQIGGPTILRYILLEHSFFKKTRIRFSINQEWIRPLDVLIRINSTGENAKDTYMLVNEGDAIKINDFFRYFEAVDPLSSSENIDRLLLARCDKLYGDFKRINKAMNSLSMIEKIVASICCLLGALYSCFFLIDNFLTSNSMPNLSFVLWILGASLCYIIISKTVRFVLPRKGYIRALHIVDQFSQDVKVAKYMGVLEGDNIQIGYGYNYFAESFNPLKSIYLYPVSLKSKFFEDACMHIIGLIVECQIKKDETNRKNAVLLCSLQQERLSNTKTKPFEQLLYKRAEEEFKMASDEEYNLLVSQYLN